MELVDRHHQVSQSLRTDAGRRTRSKELGVRHYQSVSFSED